MCNHYRNDIRKLGLEREVYGFEEFSDLPRDIYPAPRRSHVSEGQGHVDQGRVGMKHNAL